MENNIAVYGAYGHTGKFIVSYLYAQGYKPILCGRDLKKLTSLNQEYPDLEIKTADVDLSENLDEAFSQAQIIVNCAGPFVDTGEPIIESALRLGKHYIDLSAEQKSVLDIFDRFSERAKKFEIVIIPAAAFYGGLGDLLSTALTHGWNEVDEIAIYTGLDSWHPTKGTRLTGKRNQYQKFIFADKQLQPLKESPPLKWNFPYPIESQEVILVPLSEIITISRHINVNTIKTYLSKNSIEDIRSAETPEPKPTDIKNRSSQHFCMEVIAVKGDEKRRIISQGKDIYAVTAPLIVEAIKRILSGNINKRGVTTTGETFDAGDFLRALDPDDIQISGVQELS